MVIGTNLALLSGVLPFSTYALHKSTSQYSRNQGKSPSEPKWTGGHARISTSKRVANAARNSRPSSPAMPRSPNNVVRRVISFAGRPVNSAANAITWCSIDCWLMTGNDAWLTSRPGNPLPGASLRFSLRFVATLRLRLRAGSGLPSAGLFCFSW